MKKTPRWLPAVILTLVAQPGVVHAQDNSRLSAIVSQHSSPPAISACPAGVDFEGEHYSIKHAGVVDPFKFLYWRNLKTAFAARLEGQPYTKKLRDDGFALIEKVRFPAHNDAAFVVKVESADVRNCDPATKTLDLTYSIYSTQPPPVFGGATESRGLAKTAPQSTAGLTQGGSPIHFTPAAGYDRSNGAFGGGSLRITPRLGKFHAFDTFTAQGQGSNSMHILSLGLSGTTKLRRSINELNWRMNYQSELAPTSVTSLAKVALSAQLDGQTKTFWKNSTLVRFGGLLQGGNMHSNAPTTLLAPQVVSSAGFGSLKGYVGLSSGTTHNALSASYGLELGTVGPAARIDWRKHIGDVADDFWLPLGDHKPLEVEWRFTAGGIQVPHTIPLPALFFGGNDTKYFIPGDAWQIHDQPVIRAIPANRLGLTSQGLGADRFASMNVTVSYPVKSQPIMPKELSTDPEFNQLLKGQIASAASVEQNYYTWKDPNFAKAMARLPNLMQLLNNLTTAVNTAQTAHPTEFQAGFYDCTSNIGVAQWDVTNSLSAKGVAQYGDLSALLPVDSNDLQSVHDACVGEVNQQLNDPGIKAGTDAVDAARTAILNDFNAISQPAAKQKADSDIAFVSRTLNTLFKDLNIFSVAPVAVLDTAWIGSAKGGLGGRRFGPGGGIRLELASYVNFTLGYAWNVNRQQGEDRGALFFSMGIRDLFH